MKIVSFRPLLRLIALFTVVSLLITGIRLSAQTPYFRHAILAVNKVDLRGNYIEVDSFDSSDESGSVNGQYSETHRRANALVALASDSYLNNFSIGNARIAGYVSALNSPIYVGPDCSVGDLLYLDGGSTGIQDGHQLFGSSFYLPEVELPFSSGLAPLANVIVTNWVVSSNTVTTSSVDYFLPQNTFLVMTNFTQTNSVIYPAEGTYHGVVTTNWYVVQSTEYPSEVHQNLVTNTVEYRARVAPQEGTYVPGTLYQYGGWWHYDVYIYTYQQIDSYTWNAFSSYTFHSITYLTNQVLQTFDYVFDDGNYKVSGLIGKVLVRGDAVIHVTGDIGFGLGALEIEKGASLKLYCSGDSVFFGAGGIINKTGSALNCLYFGLPSNSEVRFSSSTQVVACVYAPQADVIIAGGGADRLEFTGSVVGRSFKANGYVKLHYDEALQTVGPTWEGELSIIHQPASQVLAPNKTHLLSCRYVGSGPVTFQWWKDGVPLSDSGVHIYPNSVRLGLNSADPQIAGDYFLVLSNSLGAITSAVAKISIGQPPVISDFSADQLLAVGDSFELEVSVTGNAPFNYQWLRLGDMLPQETNVVLTVSESTPVDSGNYQVVVSNAFGAVTSAVVQVVVVGQPLPGSATQFAGESVTFVANVFDAEGLSFQWYHDDNIIAGGTNSALVLENLQPDQSGTYFVTVSNSVGTVPSASASLAVDGSPRILVQPKSQTINYGEPVVLSVSAAGAGTLHYQWSRGAELLADATNASLDLGNVTLTAAASYSVSVSNNFGFVISEPTELVVQLEPPQISLEPEDFSVTIGSTVLFTTAAISPAPITFQWQRNGEDLPGQTAATLQLNHVHYLEQGSYQCVLRNEAGTNSTRAAVLSIQLPDSPFISAAGVYNGLFAQPDVLSHDTAGFFTLKVRTNGRFSGKFMVDGDGVSKSGIFNSNGQAAVTILRTRLGKIPLTVQLNLNFTDAVTGTVSDGYWQSDLVGFAGIISTNPVAGVDGKYTFLLPTLENLSAASPKGTGFSFLNVKRAKIASSGFLVDGNALKQSVHYSKNGHWPFYARHYLGTNFVTNSAGVVKIVKNFRGSTIGWLTLSNQAPSGTLHWQMPADANRYYLAGLTNSAEIIGSSYVRPLMKGRILNLTNGVVSVFGGGLSEEFTNSFLLKTNNAVQMTSNNKTMKLAFSATRGAFSGNFIDGTNRIVFRGAMLQDQNFGAGFFSPTNGSGNVTIEAVE